jgi:CheY-like chemotaxis protein
VQLACLVVQHREISTRAARRRRCARDSSARSRALCESLSCNFADATTLERFDERRGAFDLVVLDMGMPVMGGLECFAELRRKSRVPILVATGYAVDAEAQSLVAAGAGIIEKPFHAEDLVREVMQMLRK